MDSLYYKVPFVLGLLFWVYALIGMLVCPWTQASPEHFAQAGVSGAGLMALAAYNKAQG